MSPFVPTVEILDGVVRAQLADATHVKGIEFDCVVDMTGTEGVVGVEVLDLQRQLGAATVVPPPATAAVHWAYDADSDAFYLRIQRDSARIQRNATGVALLDKDNRLVAIEVTVPSGAE